jgi:hypothetical protein
MFRRILTLLLCAILLLACDLSVDPWVINPSAPSPYFVGPSSTPVVWMATPTPQILTPTPVGNTPTFTPVASTQTSAAQTGTPTSTATATTLGYGTLKAEIIGCNTSLDISHQMGEVTNGYVTISNLGGGNLTNVCATLSASDEARRHPDKSKCIPSLPARYQVTLKLTVDTGFKQDTSIQADVTTNEGMRTTVARPSCREIGFPNPNMQFDIVQPIP